MILEGYGIEILVNNNNPLREYSEPYETSKEQITTKPSIIQDIKTGKCYESDRTVFVAVPRPEMEFTVKLWADSANRKTYRVNLYIDGIWDRVSYTLTDTHSTIIDYFINENDKKKYNFLFAPSLWTDDNSKFNLKEDKSHGFGSISVEFFEAVWTLKENEKPSINDTQLEESPSSEEDKPLIKRAGNRNSIVGIGAYYGWKSADKPSAVLTVHYRPKEWLKSRGLTPDPLYSRLSPEPLSESEGSEFIYESGDEIERGFEQLKRIRSHKYGEENSYRKRKREFQDKRNTKNNRNVRPTAIEKCNGKRADNSKKDNSRKDRKVSNTPNVKFARYFEEIIEETKFIDIEAGLNSPTEEIRRNKRLREIIEILDSDDN